MENRIYSNAVVTFSRRQMLTGVVEADESEQTNEETYGDVYVRAVEGSFHESYFKDPATGRFCMPNYNKDWKGLVKLKDITSYKQTDYAWKDREERKSYTIDDFENKFPFVVFEVQEFPDFLQKLPAACFNKGIKKDQVIEVFEEYEDFLKGGVFEEGDFDFFDDKQAAVNVKLLEIADTQMTQAGLWAELDAAALRKICKANRLDASGISASMIKRLIAADIQFPYQPLRPTELLRQCYGMFVDLYIDQIKTNADHFHPLYFKDLWEQVAQTNYFVDELERKVKELLKKPYWEERLCKAARVETDYGDN